MCVWIFEWWNVCYASTTICCPCFSWCWLWKTCQCFYCAWFEVSITLVRPQTQPKSKPFKLNVLFVNGLLCCHANPRFLAKVALCFGNHNKLWRNKLWDLKDRPWLRVFMSLLLHDFNVGMWSSMEEAICHNVIWWALFLKNIICRLQFIWCAQIETFSLVWTFISFLKRNKYYLFNIKIGLVVGWVISVLLLNKPSH